MQTNKLIIGITGHIASGKTTITKYLEERYGAVSFRFSDMLADMLDRVHLEKNREHMQVLSTSLRELFGQDLMSKVIAMDVETTTAKVVVVEGIRRPTDITYLKTIPGFHLIAVSANMEARYDRITSRNEKADDAGKTFEIFKKDHERETEILINTIAKTAEVQIDNTGTLEELYTAIDDMMSSLQAK